LHSYVRKYLKGAVFGQILALRFNQNCPVIVFHFAGNTSPSKQTILVLTADANIKNPMGF
jgi:hypothetical protein